jgi:hypothetical protein
MIGFATGACAQSGTVFWPQIETYIGLTPTTSLFLMAGGSPGEDGKHQQIIFGPSIDISLWPFLNPHLKTLNPDKSKYLTFAAGYRYLETINTSTPENRGVIDLTPRVPLPWHLQLGDRNRIDLRGLPDTFTWRYRNRPGLARSFQLRKFVLTPYGEAEIFYDCKLGQWTQYTYIFGSIFKLSSRVEIDTSFKHRISIPNPNNTLNTVGLKLLLFFNNPGN